jgi:hypothetical protein
MAQAGFPHVAPEKKLRRYAAFQMTQTTQDYPEARFQFRFRAREMVSLSIGWVALGLMQLALGGTYIEPYDEGLILYGASRVAHGAMPYRDFWSMYGPGSFITLAVLDRIFGESVMIGRILDAAFRSGAVVLVFLLAKRMAGLAWGCLGGLVAFVFLAELHQYLFPALPAAVFALWSLHALSDALCRSEGGSRLRWGGIGIAAGMSFLFRPDFGLAAVFACLWAVWIPFPGERFGVTRPASAAGALGLGFVLVVGPVSAWLLAGVSATDLYDNLVRLPAEIYVPNRSLPFPDPLAMLRVASAADRPGWLLGLVVYVPLLVAVAAVFVAALRRRRRDPAARGGWASQRLFEALLCLLVLLCVKGSVRVEPLHMAPALLVAVVAMASMLAAARDQSATMVTLCVAACALAALALAVGLVIAPPANSVASRLSSRHPKCSANARLGCFVLDPGRAAALGYLDEKARPGDLLYVGAGRHDKLLANDVELYFLSGMSAATKWADLHPGVQTTRGVQDMMVAEMRAHPPAFVVLDTAFDDKVEPNASSRSSGVTVLDEFIRASFIPVFTAASVTVSVPR